MEYGAVDKRAPLVPCMLARGLSPSHTPTLDCGAVPNSSAGLTLTLTLILPPPVEQDYLTRKAVGLSEAEWAASEETEKVRKGSAHQKCSVRLPHKGRHRPVPGPSSCRYCVRCRRSSPRGLTLPFLRYRSTVRLLCARQAELIEKQLWIADNLAAWEAEVRRRLAEAEGARSGPAHQVAPNGGPCRDACCGLGSYHRERCRQRWDAHGRTRRLLLGCSRH